MMVWLNVPFSEKDEAKKLGARWNPARKKWYVNNPASLEPFARWQPETSTAPASSAAPSAPLTAHSDTPPAGETYIYCDGACRGNPGGPGGWGAWIQTPEQNWELIGGNADTTNNRMELMAAIEALRALEDDQTVTVFTDSQYLVKGMNEWRHGWIRKNWKDVKNVELWKDLIAAAARHRSRFVWVRGHNGHAGNERADRLANEGLELAQSGTAFLKRRCPTA